MICMVCFAFSILLCSSSIFLPHNQTKKTPEKQNGKKDPKQTHTLLSTRTKGGVATSHILRFPSCRHIRMTNRSPHTYHESTQSKSRNLQHPPYYSSQTRQNPAIVDVGTTPVLSQRPLIHRGNHWSPGGGLYPGCRQRNSVTRRVRVF